MIPRPPGSTCTDPRSLHDALPISFRKAGRRGAAIGRPIRFLLSPDEEIGSPTTRALVEDLGRRSSHVLVMEPARPGGAAVTARKGVGWFDVEVEGRDRKSTRLNSSH